MKSDLDFNGYNYSMFFTHSYMTLISVLSSFAHSSYSYQKHKNDALIV